MKRNEVRYWHTLYNLAKAFSSTLSLEPLLNLICRDTTEAMNVKGCAIRLLDRKGEKLELFASHGLSKRYVNTLASVDAKANIRDALDGRTVFIYDAARDRRIQYPEEAVKEGICSILAVPLKIRDRPIGSLRIYTAKPYNFDKDEKLFLSAIASLSAVTIQNAKQINTLYNVTKAFSSTLSLGSLLDLICRDTTEAMNVKGCAIRLLDRKGEKLELFGSHGLSKEYLKKGNVDVKRSVKDALDGKPVVIYDVAKDSRIQYPEEAGKEGISSILAVPLKIKDRPIGSLRIYTAKRRKFDKEDIHFLSTIAGLASLAIDNAKLYSELHSRYIITLKNWQDMVNEVWQSIDVWGEAKKPL